MKGALNWWYNILTKASRNSFPKPKSDEDILAYYENPAEHCESSNHRY